MGDILKGEKDLNEPKDADGNLLEELRLLKHGSAKGDNANKEKQDNEEQGSDLSSEGQIGVSSDLQKGQRSRPFERKPGRDPIGTGDTSREEESDEDSTWPEDEEALEDESGESDLIAG